MMVFYQQLSNHIRDLHGGDWQPNGPREARLCGYRGRTPMEEHVEGEMMTLFWWMPPKSHCPHPGEEWWRNTQLDCWRTSQGLYGLKDFGFQGLQSDDVNRWKAAMQKTLHSKIRSKAQSVILDKKTATINYVCTFSGFYAPQPHYTHFRPWTLPL